MSTLGTRHDGDPEWERYVNEVHNGAPWDCIIVDGLIESRLRCVQQADGLLKTGGFILLDDAHWPKYADIPGMLRAYKRLRFRGLGPERTYVTQTDIYVAG